MRAVCCIDWDQTLAAKYKLAHDNDFLGVGVWEISNAPYPQDGKSDKHKAQREAMWTALANWNQ